MSKTKIFLSYRRQDSAAAAGRIYDRLCAHFGDDAVFMDIDSIPFGVDFREHINSAVDQCGVLLAVIGPNWAGGAGAPRQIDDPRDFLRMEIEAALERKLPVVPILIDRTRMPGEADLPPSLAPLAYRNAIDLDQGRDFHHHVNRLINGIERLLQQSNLVAMAPPSQPGKPAAIIPAAREQGRSRKPEPSDAGQRPKPPSPQPTPEWMTSIEIKFALVPAGTFRMGSTDADQNAITNEKPQHEVRITRPFYLGTYEVTQGQYQAVAGQNPSYFKGSDDLPVEQISWLDAVRFCNTLSEREVRNPYYRIDGDAVTIAGGDGYRLPTEAEWEYACRAGTTTRFSFGDDESALGQYAWYSANSNSQTHPVGEKQPNAFGLYDMHGNVWEWCWDGYAADYYQQAPAGDPRGPGPAAHRVSRGGSWNDDARRARSACRDKDSPGLRYYTLGFRLARDQSAR
jgi:formylglycine-generating enzyme required for sulfatase activity